MPFAILSSKISGDVTARNAEAGVTLIEVMVAMACSIVVIITVSNTMVSAGRSAVSVRLDGVSNALLTQFVAAFRNPTLCANAFKDAAGNPLDITRTALVNATDVINVPRFDINGSYIARVGKYSSGVLISAMTLNNPIQVGGNRYRWTFQVKMEKKDQAGVAYSATPATLHNFRITMTTNEGSPDWHVVSCGLDNREPPPVAPPSIVSTPVQWAANSTQAVKDAKCNEVGANFVNASTLDFLQIGVAPSDPNNLTSAIPFVVSDSTTAVYSIERGSPGANGRRLRTVNGGSSGQIACVSKTAPLRFTRGTVAVNATLATMNAACNTELGPNYVPALASDLIQYGFSPMQSGASMPSSSNITVAGSTIGCKVGFNPTIGLAMDCAGGASGGPNSLACVIRPN